MVPWHAIYKYINIFLKLNLFVRMNVTRTFFRFAGYLCPSEGRTSHSHLTRPPHPYFCFPMEIETTVPGCCHMRNESTHDGSKQDESTHDDTLSRLDELVRDVCIHGKESPVHEVLDWIWKCGGT